MKLAIMCPSTGGEQEAVRSWLETSAEYIVPFAVDSTISGEGAGYLQKVQSFYKMASVTHVDVIAYFHSDLFIHEKNWDLRVLQEFDTCENCGHSELVHKMQAPPSMAYPVTATRLLPCGKFFNRVVLVSFFGAKELGRPNIYVDPYDYRQLARGGCYSNMRDWFNHGQRCTGSMDVAMIDSFSLIVRRSFLDLIGGWPMQCPPSHGSDMWLCMMAARHKKKVRLVGIDCTHNSGGVRGDGSFDYPAWAAQTKWGSDANMHQVWHKYLYEEFRDVLPIRVS